MQRILNRGITLRTYCQRLRQLVSIERKAEITAFKARLESCHIKQLQHEGLTLLNVVAHRKGFFHSDPVIRFSSKSKNSSLPFHRFNQGDVTLISQSDPLVSVDARGVVLRRSASHIDVVLRPMPHSSKTSNESPRFVSPMETAHLFNDHRVRPWRLDKAINDTGHDRIQSALKTLTTKSYRGPKWIRKMLTSSCLPEQIDNSYMDRYQMVHDLFHKLGQEQNFADREKEMIDGVYDSDDRKQILNKHIENQTNENDINDDSQMYRKDTKFVHDTLLDPKSHTNKGWLQSTIDWFQTILSRQKEDVKTTVDQPEGASTKTQIFQSKYNFRTYVPQLLNKKDYKWELLMDMSPTYDIFNEKIVKNPKDSESHTDLPNMTPISEIVEELQLSPLIAEYLNLFHKIAREIDTEYKHNSKIMKELLRAMGQNLQIAHHQHLFLTGNDNDTELLSVLELESILNEINIHDPQFCLNADQLSAVFMSILAKFVLVQGPPGTGKTRTAVRMIQAWARSNSVRRLHAKKNTSSVNELRLDQIHPNVHLGEINLKQTTHLESNAALVVAPSNVAVDQLLQHLTDCGLKVLRIGDPVRIRNELRDCSVHARIQKHPQYVIVQKLLEASLHYADAYEKRLKQKRKQTRSKLTNKGHLKGVRTIREGTNLRIIIDKGQMGEYDKLPSAIASAGTTMAISIATKEQQHIMVSHDTQLRRRIPYEWLTLSELKEYSQDCLNDAKQTEQRIAAQLIEDADVICATNVSAGSEILDGVQFNYLLMDEASQSSEPDTIIPLSRLVSDHAQVAFIGDQHQLPPTVLAAKPLSISLFERIASNAHSSWTKIKKLQSLNTIDLTEQNPVTVARNNSNEQGNDVLKYRSYVHDDKLVPVAKVLLRMQYRMHPSIAAFPNWAFYGGLLHNGPNTSTCKPPTGITWPKNQPVAFVQCDHEEKFAKHSTSPFNPGEAQRILRTIQKLLPTSGKKLQKDSFEISAGDIGIITPYAAQVKCIADLLKRKGYSVIERFDASYDEDWEHTDLSDKHDQGSPDISVNVSSEQQLPQHWLPTTQKLNKKIEIRTIDGFQGNERKVILVSTVRSNTNDKIGFLSDWRRLNVALTRAKQGLIVIGNENTLRMDPVWSAWLDWIDENDLRYSSV